jgi:hypothetical protein
MPRYHDLKSSQNDPSTMDRLIRYLAKHEGFVARPTLDPNKTQYNIGYGSKVDTSKPGWQRQSISREAALDKLKSDYLRHRDYAAQALRDSGYANPSGRLLDGLGLLFFNSKWGELQTSKRFKEAAKVAARGDEDALISFARSIDTVNGKPNADIATRRAIEAKYMKGGEMATGEAYRPTIKPSKPVEAKIQAAKPTETIPTNVASSEEGRSIWDRIKGYVADAGDALLGTNEGPKQREQEYLDRYRKASKPDAKPTPSTPIAAAQADEPGIKALPAGNDEEARQREVGDAVRDMVLDPEVMNEITRATQEGGDDIGQEIMKRIWMAKNPDKPVPETISEEDLQLSEVPDPTKIGDTWAPEMNAKRRELGESMGRTRAMLRKRTAQAQDNSGTQPPSTVRGGI